MREHGTVAGHRIHVWSFQERMPCGPEAVESMIIAKYKHNIRLVRAQRNGRPNESGRDHECKAEND